MLKGGPGLQAPTSLVEPPLHSQLLPPSLPSLPSLIGKQAASACSEFKCYAQATTPGGATGWLPLYNCATPAILALDQPAAGEIQADVCARGAAGIEEERTGFWDETRAESACL